MSQWSAITEHRNSYCCKNIKRCYTRKKQSFTLSKMAIQKSDTRCLIDFRKENRLRRKGKGTMSRNLKKSFLIFLYQTHSNFCAVYLVALTFSKISTYRCKFETPCITFQGKKDHRVTCLLIDSIQSSSLLKSFVSITSLTGIHNK